MNRSPRRIPNRGPTIQLSPTLGRAYSTVKDGFQLFYKLTNCQVVPSAPTMERPKNIMRGRGL